MTSCLRHVFSFRGTTNGSNGHPCRLLEVSRPFHFHSSRVGALAYLSKLQSWDSPEKTPADDSAEIGRPPRGRTRASAREHNSWDENKSQPVPEGIGPDYITRGFPFCIIEKRNRLPANFFTDGFDIPHLQPFKRKVKGEAYILKNSQ